MTRQGFRTATCSKSDASGRLAQSEAFLHVAGLTMIDEHELATPGVVAALTVLAGIAAADAVCCARLGVRSRGQDHRRASELVRRVAPDGDALARALDQLLSAKDDAHYGMTLMSRAKAERMLARAAELVESARRLVQS